MENLPEILDFKEGEKYLVFAAHPDDEIFGLGGTLSFLSKASKLIDLYIFSKGEEWGEAQIRVAESIEASKVLGYKQPTFFDFPDGKFLENKKEIEKKIKEIISKENYDRIFCPSFDEFHKDHKVLCFSLIKIFQSIRIEDPLQEKLWNTKVYFYEIYGTQKINSLFDITPFIDFKKEAIKKFKSQLEKKDFLNQIIGLNSYRSFTLTKDSKFAEGFFILKFQEILKKPITYFIKDKEFYESPYIPISVIVRTKNRENFLKDALNSLKNSFYKIEKIIIVNDGEMEIKIDEFLKDMPIEILKSNGKGRAYAANLGIKNAKTDFVSFLDDDDLIYEHHFNVLSKGIIETRGDLVYTDSLSSIYEYNEEKGIYELKDKIISYSMDFDTDILLYDNYIPLNTILFKKELFPSFGFFNENLEKFEDWELLIRFSRKIPFYHIKELTCEYRHFSQSHSLGSNSSKKQFFQKDRIEVLKLTKDFRNFEVEERVVKSLKDKNFEIQKQIQILKGELWFLKEKIKEQLKEKEKDEKEKEIFFKENENLRKEMENILDLSRKKDLEIEKLSKNIEEVSQHLNSTYNEIKRLNSVLMQIYSSKIWKLHNFIQKIKAIFRK